ncbi:MAG: hypothetical protein M1831_002599 [Alyxoria varia]|nr:MAG: hypothetical protein M1831_002599 [Alyxoria varia]
MADDDGEFRRQESQFRNFISSQPGASFPPEKDRYVLYLNMGCPWAHRTNIVRSLKGLEDVIQLAVMDFELTPDGWVFTGRDGTHEKDPLYGFKYIRELYWKADPTYKLRYTVPLLWDKKKETIVSNESSEIIRMLYREFDDILSPEHREVNKPGGGIFPDHLQKGIVEMNEWVYHNVNNGVYKTGFASTQKAYEENLYPLFDSLDRLEKHLSEPGHQPFLFGDQVTEADIYVYPIKSLRGFSLDATTIGQRGMQHDRRFMLLKVRRPTHDATAEPDYDNMHVSHYPQMCLLTTEYHPLDSSSESASHLRITYKPSSEDRSAEQQSHLVPLHPPNAKSLPQIKIKMHQSETIGRLMPPDSSKWFSERFGFEVVLVYLANETEGRPVLGNIAPNAVAKNAEKRAMQERAIQRKTSYLSWMKDMASYLRSDWPFSNSATENEHGTKHRDYRLTFADCAPYLIASSKSLENIRSRIKLQNDELVDMMRFRPNIVVSGASEAFEEDYWREIQIAHQSISEQMMDVNAQQEYTTKLLLTANCVRCASLNIDYKTGRASNPILKSLQTDRRVDKGHKYGPVFGRYAFLSCPEDRAFGGNTRSDADNGSTSGVPEDRRDMVCVGDSVQVSAWNRERTTLKWPGMGSTPKEDWYPVD